MRRTKSAAWVWGSAVTGLAFAIACASGPSFEGVSDARAGTGGADDAMSPAQNVGAGNGGTSAQGGQSDSNAGVPPIASGGDAGGAPPVTPTADCVDGYSDWFASSFSFPNGDVVGSADFPAMPWTQTGALRISAGRLGGTGVAFVSQGTVFPYAGSRLRFRARFSDSKQKVTAAFDAAKDGTGGVRLTLDAAGSMTLTEGKIVVASTAVPPLDSGVDWFVEAAFKDTSASVSLSRNNYASEKEASLTETLTTDRLKITASGGKAVAELASASGTSPEIDEISFARCGVEPPELTSLLIDTFERAASKALGNAEFPASASWVAVPADQQSDPEAEIVDGALEVTGLSSARIPLARLPLAGLRIRMTIRAVSESLWANVNYGAGETVDVVNQVPGFWVWNSQDSLYVSVFGGKARETKFNANLVSGTRYFVQLDRDETLATLTVRKTSFAGEVVVVFPQTDLPLTQNAGQFFWIGTSAGIQKTAFEDIRIDHYEVP